MLREDTKWRFGSQCAGTADGLDVTCHFSELLCGLVIGPDRVCDLREVADATAWDDRLATGAPIAVVDRAKRAREAILDNAHDPLVQLLCAVVVEPGGNRCHHREVPVRHFEGLPVATNLFAHIPERITRSVAVRLVDGDHISEIQHVDLLELGCCPVFRCHHIHGNIRRINDLGV